jgi:hypothetical protein
MMNIQICRTRALKRFREKLGDPVRSLNTIVIGLQGIAEGNVSKPDEMSVSWFPANLARTTREARGFAVRSLVTAACDALDRYLYDMGDSISPVEEDGLKSILRREPQFDSRTQVVTDTQIDTLLGNLKATKGDPSGIRSVISTFTDRALGRSRRTSIRSRAKALYDHCQSRTVSAASYAPPAVYHAAVELLVAWRNRLVHDSDEENLGDSYNVLLANAGFLTENHAAIDIARTLATYKCGNPPTLKDVSTLVSILLRYISAIDKCLLESCDPDRLFKEVLFEELRHRDGRRVINKWLGRAHRARLESALTIVAGQGFVPETFEKKKGDAFAVSVGQEGLACLDDDVLREWKLQLGHGRG